MKTVRIFKIGGKITEDPAAMEQWISQLKLIDSPFLIVHGGGVKADEMLSKLGIERKMIQGRRITDKETLEVVVMVYAGWINKKLTAQLQRVGIRAIGLSGPDGRILTSVKRPVEPINFGEVGDLSREGVETTLLTQLLDLGYVPVLSAITCDGEGALLNTNADAVASAVAQALAIQYRVELYFCFEKMGVLREDQCTVIEQLSDEEMEQGLIRGAFSEGILPKIEWARKARQLGVQRVCIGAADQLNAMITQTGLFTEVLAN